MFKTWFGLARDAVLLGFETQRVIGLRLAKMAEGGPAARGRGPAHGHGEVRRPGRSGDDAGHRRLAADGRSPLSQTRQGQRAAPVASEV